MKFRYLLSLLMEISGRAVGRFAARQSAIIGANQTDPRPNFPRRGFIMPGRMTVASGFCLNCVLQLLLCSTSMQPWRETARLPMFFFHYHLMVMLLLIFMKYVLTDHA